MVITLLHLQFIKIFFNSLAFTTMNKTYLFQFIVLLYPISGLFSIEFEKYDRNDILSIESGVKCLDFISRFYFNAENFNYIKNVVVAHHYPISSPIYEIQSLYLKLLNDKITNDFLYETLRLHIISNSYSKVINFKFFALINIYIIIIDDFNKLINLFEDNLSKNFNWNAGAKFLILYYNNRFEDIKQNGQYLAFKIFDFLLKKYYVIDISILFATNTTKYDLLTLDIFNQLNCREVFVKKVTSCDNGKIENQLRLTFDVMLKQTNNLENCTFFGCAKESEPFFGKFCKSGIELQLIKMIQSQLGFKVCTYVKTL